MKKLNMKIISLFLLVAFAATTFAQEEEEQKKDNTGTNPVNFTYDARFYHEWAALDIDNGDGSLITNYFEFRFPFGRDLASVAKLDNEHLIYQLSQKFGARMRFRQKSLNVTTTDTAGMDVNTNISGIGDIDARLLTVIPVSKRFMVAPGFEASFNTATHDAMGYGKTVLTPMVFALFPGLLGKGSLFVPGYQYLFSVGGDDSIPNINRSTIDIYFVWLFKHSGNWLIVDPQILIDHENNTVPMLVELEWGTMIKPVPGASVYLRPGVGVGADKPYVWNFEFGLKFIWR
jgi:hypothetical protein